MRPHVVRACARRMGLARQVEPVVVRRVVSEQTARTMLEMLTSVVMTDRQGAAVPGYSVAGKTGTAQKVDPATGRYSHRKIVASFVGRFRRRRRGSSSWWRSTSRNAPLGSGHRRPTFREIAQDAMKYLKVPPSPRGMCAWCMRTRRGDWAILHVATGEEGARTGSIIIFTRSPRKCECATELLSECLGPVVGPSERRSPAWS